MKKIINGHEIKITRAGYLYVDGIKATQLRLTPLNRIPSYGIEIDEVVHAWIFKNYVMCSNN